MLFCTFQVLSLNPPVSTSTPKSVIGVKSLSSLTLPQQKSRQRSPWNEDVAIFRSSSQILFLNDLRRCVTNEWLSCNAMSIYMRLLQQRSERNKSKLRLMTLGTNFVKRVKNSADYKASAVDTRNFDLLLFPIHVNGNHWIMAVIRITEKAIELYDSMDGAYELHHNGIFLALVDCMTESSESDLESFWSISSVPCPQQGNSIDCGVFALTVAEHVSRNAALSFSQSEMPELREKIAADILRERVDLPKPKSTL